MRVVLPEGATVVDAHSASNGKLTRMADDRRFTYLDTPMTGRTVISFTATNLVDESNEKLTVRSACPCAFHPLRCTCECNRTHFPCA